MFVGVRAAVYAALVLLFIVSYTRGHPVAAGGVPRVIGFFLGIVGAAIVLWCVATFVAVGKGTPAPFDAPRRLVTRGPYRFVRNPIYVGAALGWAGGALVYQSWALLGYLMIFLLAAHLFVVGFEEPALRRSFGHEYNVYCGRVRRWLPRWPERST